MFRIVPVISYIFFKFSSVVIFLKFLKTTTDIDVAPSVENLMTPIKSL